MTWIIFVKVMFLMHVLIQIIFSKMDQDSLIFYGFTIEETFFRLFGVVGHFTPDPQKLLLDHDVRVMR